MLTGGAEGFSTGDCGVAPGAEGSGVIARFSKQTNKPEELWLIRDEDGSELEVFARR
jgi:hypothetical protein